MAVHLETADDIRKAYGLPEPDAPQPAHVRPAPAEPPAAAPEPVEEDKPRPSPLTQPRLHIDLSREYEARGVRFSRIDLQPPRSADYWTLGEPYDVMPSAEGKAAYVEHIEVIRAYAAVCVKPDPRLSAGDMIDALDIRDARALKVAVLRFFTAPAAGSA